MPEPYQDKEDAGVLLSFVRDQREALELSAALMAMPLLLVCYYYYYSIIEYYSIVIYSLFVL